MLPGIVGSIQAMETIKLIFGAGENLVGRLLLFDALALKFRELKLRKNANCPMCGPNIARSTSSSTTMSSAACAAKKLQCPMCKSRKSLHAS